jgi:IS30 family transposase
MECYKWPTETELNSLLHRSKRFRLPIRKRSKLLLTLSEREGISIGIVADLSNRSISKHFNRSPSVISPLIKRNYNYYNYRAAQADLSAWQPAHSPKRCKNRL